MLIVMRFIVISHALDYAFNVVVHHRAAGRARSGLTAVNRRHDAIRSDTNMELARDAAQCARCGVTFRCGRNDLAGCWCARLPSLERSRYDAAAGCLCEACLRALLEDAGPRR
jgi:hypothetical protein